MSDSQLFQILGLACAATGLGVLLWPSVCQQVLLALEEFRAMAYLTAFLLLTIGGFLVAVHHDWTWSRSVLITIIGWLALLGGLSIFILPKTFLRVSRAMKRTPTRLTFQAALLIALGVLFLCLSA